MGTVSNYCSPFVCRHADESLTGDYKIIRKTLCHELSHNGEPSSEKHLFLFTSI